MPDTPAPDRLAEALEAFLGRPRADEAPTQDWLARRAELAEFLEPMLVRDGGEPAPPPPRADAPRDVGPYRLLHELGRGGMGIVFEAARRDDGTHAAVKLLPAARAWSAQAVERFRREARAAAKLDHPGIVRVLGSGTDDTPAGELHWLAMELVRGRSLRDAHLDVRTACDGDPEALPSDTRLGLASNDPTAPYWHEVAELGAQLADALAHAHAQGVVHRDVKPQNVLIDEHGHARLVDFGLARDEQEQTLTRSGDFAGTPHYTSPEQISGPRDAIDGRSDLFSLGVLLFELLAMRRPFQGDDATAVLDAIRHAPAPSLRVLAPATPKGLATIVTRLLEKRASERPATAALVAADLRAVRDGGSVAMRPIPARVLAMRFVQRHPVGVLAVVVAVLTAIGTPAAVAFHLHRTQAAVAAEQARTARNYARARLAIESQLHEVAAVDLDDVPGMAALRLRLFASARDLYRELLAERPDDLAMARLVAAASAGVAHASLALGRAREAVLGFDEALNAPPGDDANAPLERASALAGRALARALEGDAAGAAADREAATAIWRAILDSGTENDPRRTSAAFGLAAAATSNAELVAVDDPERALEELATARAAWLAAQPSGDRLALELARVDATAASAWLALAMPTEAERALSAAEQALASAGDRASRRRQSVRTTLASLRAALAAERGDAAAAEAAFREARRILDERIAADPLAQGARITRAAVLRREAARRLRAGDAAAALLVSTEALDECLALVENEPGQPSRRFELLNAHLTHAAALQVLLKQM